MSDPRPAAPPSPQRFTLAAAPPVRPLAIAAVTVVVASALLVAWRALDLSAVLAGIGLVLMLLGLALAVAALVLRARLRTDVRLTQDALIVQRAGRERALPWSEMEEVSLHHPRLIFRAAEPERSLVVVNPRSESDRVFRALQETVRQRLDADRGYGPSVGGALD